MYVAHQKSGKITLCVLGDWLRHVEEHIVSKIAMVHSTKAQAYCPYQWTEKEGGDWVDLLVSSSLL